jgi:uncharacterized membrane protein
MPVRPSPSLGVKLAVAAVFVGGLAFGAVAALSEPEPKATTRPTPVVVAKAEPTQPETPPAPEPKAEPKAEPKKPEPEKPTAVTYQKVQAIFKAACVSCHGTPAIRGMFDIRTPASIMAKKGMVVPGKPEESEVWNRVDGDLMPPPEAKITLTPGEKKLIKDWIAGGAK